MKKCITSLSLLLLGCGLFAQEICDNGIDDDNDGLIDLNDGDDCNCGTSQEYIPNPSFEERTCTSTIGGGPNSILHCLTDWDQVTATPDYHHDFQPRTGTTGFTIPIPDGESHVGFYVDPGNKESFGACLLQPLLAGTTYEFEFTTMNNVGPFGSVNTLIPRISLFGHPSCDINTGSSKLWLKLYLEGTMNCLEDTPNSVVLEDLEHLGTSDAVALSQAKVWETFSFQFTPTKDLNYLIIGTHCDDFQSGKMYFHIDDLKMRKIGDSPEVKDISVNGALCNDDMILQATATPANGSWQWYKDGVALAGETNSQLTFHLVIMGQVIMR